MRTPLLCLAALALTATLAPAASASTAAEGDMTAFDKLSGKWNCTAVIQRGPTAPKVDGTAAVDGVWDSGKSKLDFSYAVKEGSKSYVDKDSISFDAAKKVYVKDLRAEEGTTSNTTSKGWSGDTIVFEGTTKTPKDGEHPFKWTYTVKDGGYTLKGEVKAPVVGWITPVTYTCKR